jgi:hypothetical protein
MKKMKHKKNLVEEPQKEKSPNEQYNINQEPIVISKITSDIILNQNFLKGIVYKHPGDLMALYWFYYYTAKWQKTNNPKATTSYAAKGLKWSEDRIRQTKKQLIKLELIEDITSRNKDTNQITGHYIYVKFIWWDKFNINTFNKEKTPKPAYGSPQGMGIIESNSFSSSSRNSLNIDIDIYNTLKR